MTTEAHDRTPGFSLADAALLRRRAEAERAAAFWRIVSGMRQCWRRFAHEGGLRSLSYRV